MYIPKFYPEKDRINYVSKYNQETVYYVIMMYIKHAISNRDIDSLVLKLESPGYESANILEYYGITEKHHGIFKDVNLITILEELKKSDEPNYSLIDVISLYETQSETLEDMFESKKEDVLKRCDIEAYFNAEMRIRNGNIQRKLRENLIIEFGLKCCLCEINLPDLLIASHIIPYSQCNSKVEIISNPNNALLLCANHDKLFESSNHISFEQGQIVIGHEIDKSLFDELGLRYDLVIHEKFMNYERSQFMEEHLKNFKLKHLK
jgi:predicted nucleic acid-binding protein